MTIAVLCGLQDEANIFRNTPGLRVFCGAVQRDELDGLIPNDTVALISAGCAGALAPDLAIGDLVIATEVILIDGVEYLPDVDWAASAGAKSGAVGRTFLSCPTEQCATAQERAALRARLNVDVVDEESFAVAKLAAARNLPFLVLRAISDTADQTILPDDAKAQNPDGSENPLPVIGDALANPVEAIREAEGFGRSLDALRAAFKVLGPDFGFGGRS